MRRPWHRLDVADFAASIALERELARELPEGHALAGLTARPLARRLDRDDVLFEIDGKGPFVVHVTWSAHPERDPQGPRTTRIDDWQAWNRVHDSGDL